MQVLALFLLAVGAGALPQSPDHSPSASATTTIPPVNSTAPYMHEKRDPGAPIKLHGPSTIANFDDDKCGLQQFGDNVTITDTGCVKFHPTNKYLYIYYNGNGELGFFPDDHCGAKKPIEILGWGDDRRCEWAVPFGALVQSVKFATTDDLHSWLGTG